MTEKNIDWLDKLHKSQEKLFNISGTLEMYSGSFFTVGNNKIGRLLYTLSEQLMEIEKDISSAAGQIVSEQLKTAQENSANLLKATLAGIEVATRDKKD